MLGSFSVEFGLILNLFFLVLLQVIFLKAFVYCAKCNAKKRKHMLHFLIAPFNFLHNPSPLEKKFSYATSKELFLTEKQIQAPNRTKQYKSS